MKKNIDGTAGTTMMVWEALAWISIGMVLIAESLWYVYELATVYVVY